ncbi:MAG: CpaF family protein [Micrococcaceae bacterium]|nr:CpaF family protein [Micrococcaceae bacterium]
MQAKQLLELEVRELIRSRGIDPAGQPDEVRELVASAAADYDARSMHAPLPMLDDIPTTQQEIFDAVAGFGPLQPLLDDPEVEEIWINSPSQIFCARSGVTELTNISLSTQEVADLVEKMLKSSGRRLDLSTPFVDAALPDGSRLHVVIPDITAKHWAVNIRKFVVRAHRLNDLVRKGSLTAQAAAFLDAAIGTGLNVLVSGATQAGKTTLINSLAASIGPRERVITVEEIFELKIPQRDVINMQCRQPNLEGIGEISLRRLVKEALRMRPDRIIVGEVREAEALDMLVALNAGLSGMCSVHANSSYDALTKICTLPLLAGENISRDFVTPTVASCFDLVVHCARKPNGHRQVTEILSVGQRVEGGIIESSPVFQMVDDHLTFNPTGLIDHPKFADTGIDIRSVVGTTA